MKHILPIAIYCLFPYFGIAQVTTEKRLEFDIKDDYEGETIYEFGETGFLMVSRSEKKEDGEYRWKFEKYSTDLISEKVREFTIDKDYYSDETFVDTAKFYRLFRDKGKMKILSMDIATMEFDTLDFETEKKTFTSGLYVINNHAYIVAVKSNKPHLLTIDLATKKRKFIPIEITGFKPEKIKVENVQLLEDSHEVIIFLEVSVTRKLSKTYVLRLDDEGNKKDTYDFSMTLTEIITSATASVIAEGKYAYTGTYSKTSRYSSEGLFFALVSDGKIEKITFFNFLELDNFLNYLPEKQQEKIEKKKEKKEKKGKELTLRYYLAPHNLIQTDDGYLYLAEAYYPTYRTEYYYTTSYVNGRTVTTRQSRQVFDGYQYTHAFFAKFNKSGEKLWDQSFEMWMTYKPFYVKRFIHIAAQEQNSLKMVYASNSFIHSKKFDFDGKILEDKEPQKIETEIEGDKTKYSFSNINFWFGNYFLAYGTQIIKNKTNDDVDKKRKVFFINKLKFE